MRRENIVRAVELALRMNTHPCPHGPDKKRTADQCTLCLAETAVHTIENRGEMPWNTSS